jgi:hypothetical protein
MDYDTDPRPFHLKGSTTGVLLLHGFTSTPQSVAYVGHAIHTATGASVSVPLLAGHGDTPQALAQTGYRDWLASAEAALDALRSPNSLPISPARSIPASDPTSSTHTAKRFATIKSPPQHCASVSF